MSCTRSQSTQTEIALPLRLVAATAVLAAVFAGGPAARAQSSGDGGLSDVALDSACLAVSPLANPALARAEDARLLAARTAIEHARLDEAERTLCALLDESTPDPITDMTARLLLGKLMLDAQRPEDALDVLMPLDEAREYDAQKLLGLAYTARGHALAAHGAHREDVAFHQELALASLEQAVELAPAGEVEAAVTALELTLYTLGDPDGALTLADRALVKSPTSGEVLLLRGCAGGHAFWNASSTGDAERADKLWSRAVDDLRAAQLELAASRVEPWVQLAWLGLQKDSALPQALEDAREAADRGVMSSLFDVAVVGAMRGDHEPAASALHELTVRDPQALTALLAARDDASSLAERFSFAIFESDGTYDEARRVHAALTAATHDSSAVWNNYALLCRDTGVFEEAYRAYSIALEINGPDARLLNDTAVVLHYHLLDAHPEHAATARTLYGEAIELADAGLAREDLDSDARAELELALKDARNNLTLLDESTG